MIPIGEKTFNKILQPGKKIKVFYSDGNINNQTRHIRAIVDDEFVVYRTWQKRKREWFYHVKHIYHFELLLENGRLFK